MLTINTAIPSPNFYPGWPAPPRLIAIHTTENPCAIGVARQVALFFSRRSTQASAHYVVGPEAIFRCVADGDRAWHVGRPANDFALSVEQTARAGFTAEEWASKNAEAMLSNVVYLLADLCGRLSIPAVCVGVAGLLRGERGITTHAQIAKAWGGSSHWDPGPNYPLDAVIARVAAKLSGALGR